MFRITNVCHNIPQNILISTVENFEKRLRLGLQENRTPIFSLSTFRVIRLENYNTIALLKMYHRWRSRRTNHVASKITKFKSAGFFLLGLFEKYCLRECTGLDMMIRIKRICEEITSEILKSGLENFENRLRLSLRNNGILNI